MIIRKANMNRFLVAALACSAVQAFATASIDPMAAPRKPLAKGAAGQSGLAPADPMAESQKQMGKRSSGKPTAAPTDPMVVAPAQSESAAPALAITKSGRSHLLCTFRITKSGKATLVRAAEVEGEPVLPETSAGPLVYEVNNGAGLVSTEGLPDPFEMRATPGPAGSGITGHHFEHTDEAELIVKIPGTKLADANLGQLSVNFYQYDGGDHVEKLDASLLRRLKANYKLRALGDVPARVLGNEIKLRSAPVVQ
ncbi:MAG: hypothetical protein RL173_2660 [Fibrobacterota bacterium]|jgi:hypothetical protein